MEAWEHASTFGEEQVGGGILLVVREVLDDTFDILRCWHEYVHCFKLWLGFSNARNRFDHWLTRRRERRALWVVPDNQRTSDTLRKDIKLLEDCAQEPL